MIAPMVPTTPAFRISAGLGVFGVLFGAFGAHGLQAVLALHPKATHWWTTAVFYHLIHAVVMMLLCALRPFPAWSWRLLAAGVAMLRGCLYLMALTRWMCFEALRPFGGLCFLVGWLLLVLRPLETTTPTDP